MIYTIVSIMKRIYFMLLTLLNRKTASQLLHRTIT
nr:MAG TPA: hypothetical protein [Crassvirales sp.]